ncbi:MAG TPA: hypothetical protein VGZ47_06610, partial [Gemmataceae bacterium]|nr:hypothetical protein [Gemmataceae bacterium]
RMPVLPLCKLLTEGVAQPFLGCVVRQWWPFSATQKCVRHDLANVLYWVFMLAHHHHHRIVWRSAAI